MNRCSSLWAAAARSAQCRTRQQPSLLSSGSLSRPFSSTRPTSDPSTSLSSPYDNSHSVSAALQTPNLMETDVLYDSVHTRIFRGHRSKKIAKVNTYNDPSYMVIDKELNDMLKRNGDSAADSEKDSSVMVKDRRNVTVHKYPLVKRRVTQQTGKGKKHRMYQLVVVGNGDGLVGYGEGKHDEMSEAHNKAYIEAVRNMDAVSRFEQRTIWTDMSIKLGSTRILMRPRPVGFGLHCNPNIHQVLKAAGIKDVSAKVWGSRNPVNVIKATCMMIQAGNAPLSMGNGIGGKGRRLDAGSGMRDKDSVERDRGRKLVDARTM